MSRVQEIHDLLNEFRGSPALLASARQELERVLHENPSFAPAYRELARYFIMDSVRGYGYEEKHLLAAEAALKRAVKIDPNNSDAFVLFGHLYQLMDRSEEAKQALRKAEVLGTDSPWLHLNWAEILYSEGKIDEANARYKAVVDGGTVDFKALRSARWGLVRGPMQRAEALLNRYHGAKSDLEVAKRELDAALSIEPNVSHLHTLVARYWLSWGYSESSGYDPDALKFAERSLKNAIDLEPMYGEAHLRLAQVYILMRRPEDARAAVSAAIANGYASPWVQECLTEIKRLENMANRSIH
jgi:Tfp pilus assembly protein PilF